MAKYTKEEKQKAIDLYIKYCKRTTRGIKELGYPNKRHTLVSWYSEYEKNGKVKGFDDVFPDFSENLWLGLVDVIVVMDKKKFLVKFKSGMEISVEI